MQRDYICRVSFIGGTMKDRYFETESEARKWGRAQVANARASGYGGGIFSYEVIQSHEETR